MSHLNQAFSMNSCFLKHEDGNRNVKKVSYGKVVRRIWRSLKEFVRNFSPAAPASFSGERPAAGCCLRPQQYESMIRMRMLY